MQVTRLSGAILPPVDDMGKRRRRRPQGHPGRAAAAFTGHEPELIFRPPTADEWHRLFTGERLETWGGVTNDRGEVLAVDHCQHGVELTFGDSNAVLSPEGVFALIGDMLDAWATRQGGDGTDAADRWFMPALSQAIAEWMAGWDDAAEPPPWLADGPTLAEALTTEPRPAR